MTTTRNALVTGASMGLGRALTESLVADGWHVIVDARDGERLHRSVAPIAGAVTAVPGDVSDRAHRRELAAAVAATAGHLELIVNNASTIGPSPQPELAQYPLAELERLFEVNAFAPLALIQELLPLLATEGATVVNVSSDAAVEAYAGWGGYGASKAALDQLTAVLAQELPQHRIYSFDPGDMNTELHRRAAPGADLRALASPQDVVPVLRALIDGDDPSGRYTFARCVDRAPA